MSTSWISRCGLCRALWTMRSRSSSRWRTTHWPGAPPIHPHAPHCPPLSASVTHAATSALEFRRSLLVRSLSGAGTKADALAMQFPRLQAALREALSGVGSGHAMPMRERDFLQSRALAERVSEGEAACGRGCLPAHQPTARVAHVRRLTIARRVGCRPVVGGCVDRGCCDGGHAWGGVLWRGGSCLWPPCLPGATGVGDTTPRAALQAE